MSRDAVKRSAKRWWARTLVVPVIAIGAVAFTTSTAATAPAAPVGLTALAQDGSVVLAWQPVPGASTYRVYRGTTAGATTTLVSTDPLTQARFTDTTAANGAAVFYAVSAVDGSGESPLSKVAGATPRARTCSSSNAIVAENCFPGTTAWKTTNATQASNGGIEGFATATSVNAGGSVALKVRTVADGVPFHVEIYRSGSYAGTQGRLVSTLVGLTANAQPACVANASTGLRDCSNWTNVATITTSPDWPTGVYLLRIVRDDTGRDNHVLLVVRRDGSGEILYGVPVSTYQAYNNYGGKSTYDWNSTGANTVAGTRRAVEVSFDRPYQQSVTGMADWYTTSDVRNVSWLERQGYDVSYTTSVDLAAPGALVGHDVFLSPVHDEYWSSGMRNAVTAARDAGTSLAFLGANAVYWKVRYAASPVSGVANRVEVVYKTIQGGVPDPSGDPTTTWRDPSGPNQPENGLLGQMYIGDSSATFRLRVSATQGQDPIWRNTSVANLAPGSTATIGTTLVGWEWDARVANGAEPPGVVSLSASTVNGSLVQGNGASYTTGSASSNATRYQAASGALVFASGTNNWSKALGINMAGVGEANAVVAQATMNLLTDMGATPETPATGLIYDGGAPSLTVTARTPAPGATGVAPSSAVTATFGMALDPATVTTSSVTLTGASGAVAASVSYDAASKTITLTPNSALTVGTTYTAVLAGSIATPSGEALGSPVSWSFTTEAAAEPLGVTARTPAPDATGVGQSPAITATFNRDLDPATVNGSNVTLLPTAGGAVAATVSYDGAARRVTLAPSAPLALGTTYTVTISTAVRGADGSTLAAPVSWSFSTVAPSSCPCSLLSGTPTWLHLEVRDGRSGAGPWSYELGTKVQATAAAQLTHIRYWRDSFETGTHVGRIWSSTGTLLASVTFTGETASGWQSQALESPLALQAGTTYIVSVGFNAYFAMTRSGLATQVTSGPIRTDVTGGTNGVYASAAGIFPTLSWSQSNYYVDVVVQ